MEEATVPTITVRNIPTDLYQRLKQSAETNRRSINSEVVVCIEMAVRSRKIQPEVILNRARKLREKTSDYMMTDNEFNQAKVAGRR